MRGPAARANPQPRWERRACGPGGSSACSSACRILAHDRSPRSARSSDLNANSPCSRGRPAPSRRTAGNPATSLWPDAPGEFLVAPPLGGVRSDARRCCRRASAARKGQASRRARRGSCRAIRHSRPLSGGRARRRWCPSARNVVGPAVPATATGNGVRSSRSPSTGPPLPLAARASPRYLPLALKAIPVSMLPVRDIPGVAGWVDISTTMEVSRDGIVVTHPTVAQPQLFRSRPARPHPSAPDPATSSSDPRRRPRRIRPTDRAPRLSGTVFLREAVADRRRRRRRLPQSSAFPGPRVGSRSVTSTACRWIRGQSNFHRRSPLIANSRPVSARDEARERTAGNGSRQAVRQR